MEAVDFITALGRVLHDGTLRDAFARDADAFVISINLRESDRPAFLRLSPADLEVQARVLLHKRFDQVRRLLPHTCRALGKSAWEEFAATLRSGSQAGAGFAVEDAHQFCSQLARTQSDCLCTVELNRCRFAQRRRRMALHLVRRPQGRRSHALQLLVRFGPSRWREWQIYFGA